MQPKFSEGQDETKVKEGLDALVKDGWELDEDQIGVRKTYNLKTYTKVMVGGPTRCNGKADMRRTFTT
jgi:hypothetical protein